METCCGATHKQNKISLSLCSHYPESVPFKSTGLLQTGLFFWWEWRQTKGACAKPTATQRHAWWLLSLIRHQSHLFGLTSVFEFPLFKWFMKTCVSTPLRTAQFGRFLISWWSHRRQTCHPQVPRGRASLKCTVNTQRTSKALWSLKFQTAPFTGDTENGLWASLSVLTSRAPKYDRGQGSRWLQGWSRCLTADFPQPSPPPQK